MKRKLLLALLFSLILASDLLSKAYVHVYIPLIDLSTPFYPFGGLGIFHNWFGIDFSINHAVNKGAAWSMFSSFQHHLLFFRILVISFLIGYLFFFNRISSRQIPLTIIIAGAIGNVIDYFMYGHVVDMFHFVLWGYSFPIFNLADSAIFCGIAWFFLESIFKKITHASAS